MVVKKVASVKPLSPATPIAASGKGEAESKWGIHSIAAGFTQIPTVLILRHKQIGLDAVDLALVLALASFWWKRDGKPFPSKKLLAQTIGRDLSVVRKRIQDLEKGKLIKRIYRKRPGGGNNTNQYDLSPLAREVDKLAKEELASREAASLAAAGKKKKTPVKPKS